MHRDREVQCSSCAAPITASSIYCPCCGRRNYHPAAIAAHGSQPIARARWKSAEDARLSHDTAWRPAGNHSAIASSSRPASTAKNSSSSTLAVSDWHADLERLSSLLSELCAAVQAGGLAAGTAAHTKLTESSVISQQMPSLSSSGCELPAPSQSVQQSTAVDSSVIDANSEGWWRRRLGLGRRLIKRLSAESRSFAANGAPLRPGRLKQLDAAIARFAQLSRVAERGLEFSCANAGASVPSCVPESVSLATSISASASQSPPRSQTLNFNASKKSGGESEKGRDDAARRPPVWLLPNQPDGPPIMSSVQ